jgi:hypothetical protein
MTDLKLYEGKKPVPVTAATLFNVVKAIMQAGKEADFLEKAKDLKLQASPEVVNFTKTYLFNNKLHQNNAMMAHIVAPEENAPTCFQK